MNAPRSPGYPSLTLPEAIDIASKLYESNRSNPIDREAAAKDMGYSGLTGTSAKALADLGHFGLLEKTGKGGVRVSQMAVDILYPASSSGRAAALQDAASRPALFASLAGHFSDGAPSANSLRAYLMRNGFASVAIPQIVKSFTETQRFVRDEIVSESIGPAPTTVANRDLAEQQSDKPPAEVRAPMATAIRQQPSQEVPLMTGERVIFVDEISPGQYLKLIASGEFDDTLLEALEDFTKRRRKHLSKSTSSKAATKLDDTGHEDTESGLN